jgi:hypothetical protein
MMMNEEALIEEGPTVNAIAATWEACAARRASRCTCVYACVRARVSKEGGWGLRRNGYQPASEPYLGGSQTETS